MGSDLVFGMLFIPCMGHLFTGSVDCRDITFGSALNTKLPPLHRTPSISVDARSHLMLHRCRCSANALRPMPNTLTASVHESARKEGPAAVSD